MTAAHSPSRPQRRRRLEAARAAALWIALVAWGVTPAPAGARLAGETVVTERPSLVEAPTPGEQDAERGRSSMTGGAGMMAGSAVVAAIAVWQWATPDAYADFMLGLSDDPGPLIDPTVFFTPGYSIALAGIGGATVLRGVAMHRGAAPEVPWTYWLPLAPAAVALGAEAFLFFHEPPSPTAHELIAAGTATSVLCFWASTVLHAARVVDATPRATAVQGASALSVVPVLGNRAGRSSVGMALSGEF